MFKLPRNQGARMAAFICSISLKDLWMINVLQQVKKNRSDSDKAIAVLPLARKNGSWG